MELGDSKCQGRCILVLRDLQRNSKSRAKYSQNLAASVLLLRWGRSIRPPGVCVCGGGGELPKSDQASDAPQAEGRHLALNPSKEVVYQSVLGRGDLREMQQVAFW